MANSDIWAEEMSKELSCSVCYQQYNESERMPKLLPCGHTFCLTCLEKLKDVTLRSKAIECPQCRQNNDLSGDPLDLCTNYGYISLLERKRKLDSLECCNKELNSEELACDVHQLKCEVYCCTCAEGLCSSCLKDIARGRVDKHAEHEVISMAEALTGASQILDRCYSQLSRVHQHYDNSEKAFLTQVQNHIDTIRKQVGEAHERLNQWEADSIRKLQYDIAMCKTRNAEKTEALTNLKAKLEEVIQTGDTVSVLQTAVLKNMSERISDLPNFPHISFSGLEFRKSSIILNDPILKEEDYIRVELKKGKNGFGLILDGGVGRPALFGSQNGIYVVKVLQKSLRNRCNRICRNDQLIAVNGKSLNNVTLAEAEIMIREIKNKATFLVKPSVIPKGERIVTITRDENCGKLGISTGGIGDKKTIFIKGIISGSSAEQSNALFRGDVILTLNGMKMDEASYPDRLKTLRTTNGPFTFCVENRLVNLLKHEAKREKENGNVLIPYEMTAL